MSYSPERSHEEVWSNHFSQTQVRSPFSYDEVTGVRRMKPQLRNLLHLSIIAKKREVGSSV